MKNTCATSMWALTASVAYRTAKTSPSSIGSMMRPVSRKRDGGEGDTKRL